MGSIPIARSIFWGITIGLDHLGALRCALSALRAAWMQGWPGLPTVVEGCLRWILQEPGASGGLPQPALDITLGRGGAVNAAKSAGAGEFLTPRRDRIARLLRAVSAAASIVEREGAELAARGCEPRYHNRLHIADTLVGLACLLRARRAMAPLDAPSGTEPASLQPNELIGLLAMLIHDFQHDGRINEVPGELERRSLQQFLPHAQSLDLSLDEWHVLTRLVISTDPATVGTLHDEFRQLTAPTWTLATVHLPTHLSVRELAVLVTEADVLASVLVETGEALGHSLMQEWADRYPDRAARVATPEGRLGFLTLGARFSSPAARHLQIPVLVQAQVSAITRQIQRQRDSAKPAIASALRGTART